MPKFHADKFFYLSNDLLCIEGADGYFKLVNPAFQKTLGYSEKELTSQPIVFFIHPEDVTSARSNLPDSLSGDKTENRFRCADGSYKWFSWTRSFSSEEDFIYASARNITKEKELEAALQKSIDEKNLIIDSSLDMICTFDQSGTFLSVNNACQAMLGYSPEELIGRNYKMFVVDNEGHRKEEADDYFASEGFQIVNYQNTYTRKDGRLIHLSWASRWSEGEKVLYSVARDVTGLKQQEELLQFSESRFKSLVHSGADLICLVDKDGKYTYVSPSIENIGYSNDFLIGKSPFDFIHENDQISVKEIFQRVLAGEHVKAGAYRFRDAEGNWRWIKSTATNKLADPSIRAIVVNSSDVTDAVILERERESALSRVKNLIENFTDGFILVDRKYTVIDFNERALELLGLKDKLFKGIVLTELFSKLESSAFFQAYEQAFEENISVRVSDFALALNRWFEVSAYPFENNLTIFFKDITAGKLRELNLKLEKNVLKMNTISDYSLKSIVDYYLIELNRLYPEIRFEVSLVNKKSQIVSPLSFPAVPEFLEVFKDGFPIAAEGVSCSRAAFFKQSCGNPDIQASAATKQIKDFARQYKMNSCWAYPIVDQKDEVLATMAVFYETDKTPTEAEDELIKRVSTFMQILVESHQTRETLALNIERYKLVTQASKDAIYDWDILGDELYWGEGLEKIFGYKDSLTDLDWWELKVHPEDLQILIASLDVSLSDPSIHVWNAEYRFLKANGAYAFIKEAGFILRDNRGKAIRMVGAMQDYTEIKEHQEQVFKQNNVLREIARINSHYIRKPLANILALIETIKAAEDCDLSELIHLLELSGCELDEITRQIARKTYY